MRDERHDPTTNPPACTACYRDLRYAEPGRMACRPCTTRVDDALASLPGPNGLYARLSDALTPGRRGGGDAHVATSHTHAPLPVPVAPLSLAARGGIVTVLQTWLTDWHDHLGWAPPRFGGDLQQQCDHVVRALRNNLDWAATSHPAFDEFAAEVHSHVAEARRHVTGERPERRVPVACGCGATIRVTVSSPGARCTGCGTQYDRTAVLSLPLANRTSAAA